MDIKKIIHNKKTIYFSTVIISILGAFLANTFAVPVENNTRVVENTDLIYYIDVLYDGKSANSVSSSNSESTCEIRSDVIFVEDKLPEGLIFKEFVNTADGTIGAVNQRDGSGCSGYVVGNYDGLNYNEENRTVSYKVKGLRAGCKLTVGVVTRTPTLGDKKRIDFYNTAYAREKLISTKSNTVHAYMGRDNTETYKVRYEYFGTIPSSAPPLPEINEYASGSLVGLEKEPNILGYSFSGWTSEDVEVINNSFEMPSHEIVFKGTFTEKETYKVSYKINGVVPDNYILPKDEFYSKDDEVELESLKNGSIFGKYVFKGWTTTSTVDLTNETFVMPEEDIEIVGSFELRKYSVSYVFEGAVKPVSPESVLPVKEEYAAGTIVTVAKNPDNTTCTTDDDGTVGECRFLGWYKNETFVMPEEDIIINGEWQIINGVFSPTIAKEITNPKDKYFKNDEVSFKIVVTNTAEYEIHEVALEEKLDGAVFLEGDGYHLRNSKFAIIDTIAPHASISVFAKFLVKDEDSHSIINTVELIGALADNKKYLDTTKEYKAQVEFKTANINFNVNKINIKNESLDGAEFSLCEDITCNNIVKTGLQFKGLNANTTYYLKETKTPEGYKPSERPIKISVDNDGNITVEGYAVKLENGVPTIDVVNELNNTTSVGENVPKTYDEIWTYILIFIASTTLLVGCGIYVYRYLKKEKK